MRKTFLRAACLSASVIALAGAAPALAQSAAAQTGSGTDSQPAAAQPTGNGPTDNGTAEIIVTAQKRPEKLQEIPVAASVLSSSVIAQAHIEDISDINRVIPSVELNGTFNGRVPYGIRGISTNANEATIGLTSGVNIQVDGVPISADSFAANTVTDVSQLEVLKGPQATLSGRTASAGVINFVTFGPTNTQHFAMNLLQTNDGEKHIDVRVSGPITQGLTYSLTGYDQYTPYPIFDIGTGQRSHGDSRGVRGKLKWEISDKLDAQLMLHYALSRSTGENFVPTYLTPGTVFFAPPAGLTQSVMFPGLNVRYGNDQYNAPEAMGSRYEDKDGALVVNYHLGDGTTLTSTTSLFRENQQQSQLVFESADPNWASQFEGFLYSVGAIPAALDQPYYPTQNTTGYVTQTTEEVKIVSDARRPFSYIAGFFYSDMTVNQTEYRNWTLNPLAQDNISTTRNYAVYARATAKLSNLFSVVGGLRYNWDKIGWNIAEFFNPAAGIYGDNGYGIGGFAWNVHNSSTALVGDIALQAHPSRDVMTYASYTRGYKPAAYNTAGYFSNPQSSPSAADLAAATPAHEEHIDSFEIGMKSTPLDRHLTFNADAFYTKYNGYQAQIYETTSGYIPLLELSNADARTEGFEADLTYVKGNTRASLSGAYIDAKFTNFPGSVCWPSQTAAQGCYEITSSQTAQNLTGASLPNSPKFKFSGNIQQTVPFRKFNMILGGDVNYRSSTLMQADQNPESRQPGFALLDMSVGFQSKDASTTLTFFVNNLTNHFYYTDIEDFFGAATSNGGSAPYNHDNYVIGMPARDAQRYFGARLSFNF